jgi:hypothetical protein
MKKIFGTGTVRTGGSLVSNILSYYNNNLIFNEVLYFFRHMYFDIRFPLSKIKLKKYCIDFYLRLKFKNNIIIEPKKFYRFISKKKINNVNDLHSFSAIYISKYYKKKKFKNLIEYSNGEWRNIKKFLELNENYKAFQVIRDPRAILSSFKLFSFNNNNFTYWHCIFNWLDAYKTMKKLKRRYSDKRYLAIKFEDLHSFPAEGIKKIIKFANNKIANINIRLWKKKLKDENQFVNISSHNKRKAYGFSKKRINNWKKNLEKWEIELVEYILEPEMLDAGYKLINKKIDFNKVSKNLKKLEKNFFIKKCLKLYLSNRNGTSERPYNVKNPKNWGVFRSGKKLKDIYKIYLKEKNNYNKINFDV